MENSEIVLTEFKDLGEIFRFRHPVDVEKREENKELVEMRVGHHLGNGLHRVEVTPHALGIKLSQTELVVVQIK